MKTTRTPAAAKAMADKSAGRHHSFCGWVAGGS